MCSKNDLEYKKTANNSNNLRFIPFYCPPKKLYTLKSLKFDWVVCCFGIVSEKIPKRVRLRTPSINNKNICVLLFYSFCCCCCCYLSLSHSRKIRRNNFFLPQIPFKRKLFSLRGDVVDIVAVRISYFFCAVASFHFLTLFLSFGSQFDLDCESIANWQYMCIFLLDCDKKNSNLLDAKRFSLLI